VNDEEAALRATLDRLEEAGALLRARDPGTIAESLDRAWELIRDPERAPGRAAREHLPASTGLSLPMIAWTLAATFERAGARELEEAVRRMRERDGLVPVPARLAVLVLAGNVFTACVQPITFALLCRAPVIVKASSRDDVLPRIFHAALAEVDAELADACAIVSFPGGSAALEASIMARADVVSAYGSDATLAAIRARTGPSVSFVAHGHGLGVGYAGKLADEASARSLAKAFALDVAAYDQRGCLSPHAVWVERGPIDARAFAKMLSESLGKLAAELPRGRMPPEVAAAQLQWRGVAAARAEIFEGDGWCVSYEGRGALRVSPGWRNVAVLDAESPEAFADAVLPLGAHLKVIGAAGDRRRIATLLAPPLAPRICAPGEMQRPSLLSVADGLPPWSGFTRTIEVAG
jgi:acyl-CoA reductase-like NAD-dependent aldehyde dehydrogenase